MDKLLAEGQSIRAIELEAEVDEQHRLHAQLPVDVPASRVRVIVLLDGPANVDATDPDTATAQTVKFKGFDANSFGGVRIETKGFKFDRDRANERFAAQGKST